MTGVAELGAIRQALVKGRISEAMTGRALIPTRVTFEIEHGSVRRIVSAAFGPRDGGYYSLSVSGGAGVPEPPPADTLTLHLSLALADGRTATAARNITGADLARVARSVAFLSGPQAAPVIFGAPFAFDFVLPPPSVTLSGTVILDHDPAQPVLAATVSIGPLTTLTDAAGRFRLTPLPLTTPLTVNVDRAGTETDFTFHPDFSSRVNSTTLSLDA